MEWFQPWMILPAWLGIHLGLTKLGKTETEIGRRLRASDHVAWELAVEQKEQELAELRSVEPSDV